MLAAVAQYRLVRGQTADPTDGTGDLGRLGMCYGARIGRVHSLRDLRGLVQVTTAEMALQFELLTYSYGIKYRKNGSMSRLYGQTSTTPTDCHPGSLFATLWEAKAGISTTAIFLQGDASQADDEVRQSPVRLPPRPS